MVDRTKRLLKYFTIKFSTRYYFSGYRRKKYSVYKATDNLYLDRGIVNISRSWRACRTRVSGQERPAIAQEQRLISPWASDPESEKLKALPLSARGTLSSGNNTRESASSDKFLRRVVTGNSGSTSSTELALFLSLPPAPPEGLICACAR